MKLESQSKFENKLISYEIKKGGFFSSDYVSYCIKTFPFGWEVNRTANEIIWLYKGL